MKLISAKIKNFRLLKNLVLDFSIEEERPLTVIQAANETGKTTCLNALIWGLYGSKSLPNRGNYSLFPSDIDRKERVEISVEIHFEMETVSEIGRGRRVLGRSQYSLQRTCYESAPKDDRVSRDNEIVILWQITREGTVQVPEAEVRSIIETALPSELKDVYFTDGDSAMSFIEAAATQSVKRKRVADSIESLLGLKVLDQTVRHLSNVVRRFSQEVDNTDYASELERLNDHIISYNEDILESSKKLNAAQLALTEVNIEIKEKEKKVEELLKLGDKSVLVSKRRSVTDHINRLVRSRESASKSLSAVISNEVASSMLLSKNINIAKNMLSNLNTKKQLPLVSVPILEELLGRSECFCGASLDFEVAEGNERRKNINNIIETSRQSDRIQEIATSLFYRVRSLNITDMSEKWLEMYNSSSQDLSNSDSSLNKLYDDLDELDSQINEIDDSQLQRIRESLLILKKDAENNKITITSSSTKMESFQDRLKDIDFERQKVRNKLGKTNSSAFNWDIASDVQKVFEEIIEKLKKEELKKVSNEMNRIFLSMIGSEEATSELPQRIQRAELTEEYDIMVYGPNDYPLNPDMDLNGASRRAITLAFILALTKVSKVEAPNIIDTPLGMMSGYVKQSVLLRTIEEGSQVILFLTHDEIRGVENIIDKYAGRFFTLTNPSHYPKMLLNKPETNDIGIVRCECGYNEKCKACERKNVEVV